MKPTPKKDPEWIVFRPVVEPEPKPPEKPAKPTVSLSIPTNNEILRSLGL